MMKFLRNYNRNELETKIPSIHEYPENSHNKITRWISNRPETCAKRNTYYAIFIADSDLKHYYLEKAINLNPEYLLAYVTWFNYWSVNRNYFFNEKKYCKDHHKTIKYGEKIMNSGLYKDHYSKIVYHLRYAYNQIGDKFNDLKYTILQINIEDDLIFKKLFGPDITIEMAKQLYLNVDFPGFSLIQRLLKENEELRLMPCGPEYQKAKEEFETLSKSN